MAWPLHRESGLNGAPVHMHLSNYLILGADQTLLIDTGIPSNWSVVEAHLDQILGERQVDWVFPTHPEYPHSGSLAQVLTKYSNALVTGDTRDYHAYYPQFVHRLVPRKAGDRLDLGGGYALTFVDAVLKDLPSTLWAYESSQRVLFVVDGFGYAHRPPLNSEVDEPTHVPGECAMTIEELEGPINPDNATFILKTALYWSRFVRADIVFDQITNRLRTYPAQMLAPAHGNVITDVPGMVSVIRQVHERAYVG